MRTPPHLMSPTELLDVWASRTWHGNLRSPIADRRRFASTAEDQNLLICIHVEGFWRSSELRRTFRRICLEEWAEYGVHEAGDALDDRNLFEEMASAFAGWVALNPMPPIYRVGTEDGRALSGEVQAMARLIGVEDAAKRLGCTERHARRLFESSQLPAWRNPQGEWVTTVADVQGFVPRENGGKREGAGRPCKKSASETGSCAV